MNTSETELPTLKCFQHCKREVDLVCFHMPYVCPLCGNSPITTQSRIPPYVLPSPFTSSERSRRSIILKPTQGKFIVNYVQTCNLHIGVSDKDGFVYDFDEKGLKFAPPWGECLAVSFDVPVEESLWDTSLLKAISQSHLWTADRYHETLWNCFDFILFFMQHIAASSEDHREFARMSKDEFTNLFLTKKTKRAEQYIHLFRQVMSKGCVTVMKDNTS